MEYIKQSLSEHEVANKPPQKQLDPTRQQTLQKQSKFQKQAEVMKNTVAAQVAHRNALNRAGNIAGWTRPDDHVSSPDKAARRPEEIPTFVIHGHSNTDKGPRLDDEWSMNLDGGCVLGGKLVAVTLDARGRREVFMVQCRKYTP